MKLNNFNRTASYLAVLLLVLTLGCKKDTLEKEVLEEESLDQSVFNADFNKDGKVNILILGTNKSIKSSSEAFSPNQIAVELKNILSNDATSDINVVSENIHLTKNVAVGLGQSNQSFSWDHSSHSLLQYYYWPEGRDERMKNLSGTGGTQWDYVVIGADPYIMSNTPGYYALGVNKIAAKVAEGGAKPLLLMLWPKDASNGFSMDHFAEYTYRTSEGAKVGLKTVPAGRVWEAVANGKRDNSAMHPTPHGAYVAAASIYSHMSNRSATDSKYSYDDDLADLANTVVKAENGKVHFTGERQFISPFKSCNLGKKSTLNYNHTGTSSERGILRGLQYVVQKASVTLEKDGAAPIAFNYGRANTNFEANKRYKIDASKYTYSFGFPMQDHNSTGNVSMLYGLDKRINETENGTDLGVALYMIRNSELPQARAIPIRTLFAQLQELIPGQSAYSDNWHMSYELDKASAGFMYTLLTGDCAIGDEPSDKTSADWKAWRAHKLGYETAWTLMHLEGTAPDCK